MRRRHINLWFRIIFLFVAGFASVCAQAQDWQDNLFLNGFFTLGVTQTNTDISMVSPAGERHLFEKGKPNLNNSLMGGQLQYQVSDRFSVFIQGAAFIDRDDKLDYSIDWAYANYDFDNDLSMRVGQFQTPFLQGTEMRKIGYSRLWTRPLTPGNGASGFNEYQGVELVKKYSSGEHFWDFQVGFGQADHQRSEVHDKNIKLTTIRYQYEDTWLRMGLIQANYAINSPVTNELIVADGDVVMASLEAETRVNHFVINAGLSASDSDSTPNDSMQYLSIGYAIDHITPYIFASRKRQVLDPQQRNNGSQGSQQQNGQGPPPDNPRPPPTRTELNDYSVAAGLRWNLSENLAVKTQLEKNRYQDRARPGGGVVSTSGSALTLSIEGVY
ncbi:hypothetical protein [Neptunicella sp. SCSIO 80796]|uniref:hypothetical protein n=1 Tax=Neptunicella plasticusilytica TaxID=3117012 RepID=UPI003A4D641A